MNAMKRTLVLLTLFTTLLYTGCKKDKDTVPTQSTITLLSPNNLTGVTVVNATITAKETNTGNTITIKDVKSNSVPLSLAQGSYDFSVEGEISYTLDGATKNTKIKGLKQSQVIVGATTAVDVQLYIYNDEANFVIKEIFFTGTVTPEGKTYNGDKYVIIHNNSDKVLYADGLAFAESDFLTTTKRVYTPDVMNEAFTTKTIIIVPGSGTEYPIKPGESFTIANNAINHLEGNANSLDLRNSKFEVDLLSSINVDNPQVPNTINVSAFLTMHNRGFKSYVLARLNRTPDQFKAEQAYTNAYTNSAGNITNTSTYKIKNSDILDAVNLSVQSVFEWIVTSPALDMGWTYCGKVDSDATRFGKSVIRKVLSTTPDGRVIYKDTNNSTVDFNPESVPSLKK
jgi:hypothetical protein